MVWFQKVAPISIIVKWVVLVLSGLGTILARFKVGSFGKSRTKVKAQPMILLRPRPRVTHYSKDDGVCPFCPITSPVSHHDLDKTGNVSPAHSHKLLPSTRDSNQSEIDSVIENNIAKTSSSSLLPNYSHCHSKFTQEETLPEMKPVVRNSVHYCSNVNMAEPEPIHVIAPRSKRVGFHRQLRQQPIRSAVEPPRGSLPTGPCEQLIPLAHGNLASASAVHSNTNNTDVTVRTAVKRKLPNLKSRIPMKIVNTNNGIRARKEQ